VIWSPIHDSYDQWALYSVEAVARGSAVTVFTRSAPTYPLQHNDIYVDDASLVVVGQGQAQPTAPAPQPTTAAPQPTQPSAPQPTATQVSGFFYTVVPGDNYYRIARRFNVTVPALLAANPTATPNLLYVGTRLLIPGVAGPVTTSPAPTSPAPAPTTPPQQLPGAFTYVVQRGDNLYRLSLRFGTTIARIKQLNNLTGDIIYIGQVLVIAP
jgi:LysM repeat protein